MAEERIIFQTKCAVTTIDYTKCEAALKNTSSPSCGFACVKADRLYDRGILRIEGNRPILAVSTEDAKRISNESLSWEYACKVFGSGAITIEVPFPGLEEFRRKMHTKGGD